MVALTSQEIAAFERMLANGDRIGFYQTYYAMTGNNQALVQSKIASFSEHVGGVAFAANRILQDIYGATGTVETRVYKGVYYLSQKVAQAALTKIKGDAGDLGSGTGEIGNDVSSETARDAWRNEGLESLSRATLSVLFQGRAQT
ncbi:hypothetical protein FV232_09465 [Methylobacterium sp. WL30]|uniref:hypothetical protein n=1 Tax=unclassified Methylobacterium TaxID=2615210 RepID=UPI0011C749A4|nr:MULTISPECIES: hypothetical protein [unclassified Methylobacterium]TXN41218.1 hypothetical protein FV225_03355 [Methylobacterium sp. WL93]TXN50630.1 hypothetical protein FV227_11225 [Methylobacterium sp. WL119]TXN68245.1 hypothetical protein FV232_09465 [Methylobacterium sp. WL30]